MEKVTKEQIAGWKKKHGDVFMLECDGKVAYVRRPDRKVLDAAHVTSQGGPLKYNEFILNNIWLGGDEEFKADDALFLGVSEQLGEIIEKKSVELKKL